MTQAQTIKRRSDCPISFGLDIFGDKWTLLILRDILFYQRTRFSDFAPRERIATNILADRLSKLEKAGLIEKSRDETLKNQYTYSITQKGKDLLPTLIDLTMWGLRYDAKSLASRKFVKRIKAENGLIAEEIAQAVENSAFLEYKRNFMGIKS